MKGETGSTLEVGKSEGIVDRMQGCRHSVPTGATWGSSGVPPGGGVHAGYALPPRAPNDPPETWLDRRAGEALAGLVASDPANEGIPQDKIATAYARASYALAAAMLAEKMRREKKEVEE